MSVASGEFQSTNDGATVYGELTHCDREKMAAISQMTLSNEFFLMKMLEFRLNFTEVCSYESN